jgi:hypothetical protein
VREGHARQFAHPGEAVAWIFHEMRTQPEFVSPVPPVPRPTPEGVLPFEHGHSFALHGEDRGGDETGNACSDNDDIGPIEVRDVRRGT